MEECEDSSSEEIVVSPPRRMKYTRGGSGGSGSCPGSLDDCVALCPSEVTLVTKIIKNWYCCENNAIAFRRRCSRRAWPPAADGAPRNNTSTANPFLCAVDIF